jgi:hypothetical protein
LYLKILAHFFFYIQKLSAPDNADVAVALTPNSKKSESIPMQVKNDAKFASCYEQLLRSFPSARDHRIIAIIRSCRVGAVAGSVWFSENSLWFVGDARLQESDVALSKQKNTHKQSYSSPVAQQKVRKKERILR